MKSLFILLCLCIFINIVYSNQNYTKKRYMEDHKPPHTPNPNKPTISPMPTPVPTSVPTLAPTPSPTSQDDPGGFLLFM